MRTTFLIGFAVLAFAACKPATTGEAVPVDQVALDRKILVEDCMSGLENKETCACQVNAMETHMPSMMADEAAALRSGTPVEESEVAPENQEAFMAVFGASMECLETSNEVAILNRCTADGGSDEKCRCEVDGFIAGVSPETYLAVAKAARSDASEDEWYDDFSQELRDELDTVMDPVSDACAAEFVASSAE